MSDTAKNRLTFDLDDNFDYCDGCEAYVPGADWRSGCSECEEGQLNFHDAMGRGIKARIQTKGMNQREVAELAGMSETGFGRFLRKGGTTDNLVKVAVALGTTAKQLCEAAEQILNETNKEGSET